MPMPLPKNTPIAGGPVRSMIARSRVAEVVEARVPGRRRAARRRPAAAAARCGRDGGASAAAPGPSRRCSRGQRVVLVAPHPHDLVARRRRRGSRTPRCRSGRSSGGRAARWLRPPSCGKLLSSRENGILARSGRITARGGRCLTTTDRRPSYYDPYDVEINADPYPTFRRLRDEAPIYYNERYDSGRCHGTPTSSRPCRLADVLVLPWRHPRDPQGRHGAAVRRRCSSRIRRCTPCTAA